MSIKTSLSFLAKLLMCGLVYPAGLVIGGILLPLLGLQPPPVPEGIDTSLALLYLLLASPLMALALALVARGLAGGFWTRTGILFLLVWIAYTINTQLEAAIFTTYGGGFWSSLANFAVPSLLCAAAAAKLFPSGERGAGLIEAWQDFSSQRPAWSWIGRLAAAALAFAPIYYLFGLLVEPFTGDYYRENLFGLQMPETGLIVKVLFLRSLLFLAACLPVVLLWRKDRLSLFGSLGFALFVFVGLLYMISAYWMPLSVRVPHTLEILADEFVYVGVLVALLKKGFQSSRMVNASQAA